METTTNYRKWVAFNNNITERRYIENLVNAIDRVSHEGSIRCSQVNDDGLINYELHDSTMPERLLLTETERADLLVYLKLHYLPSAPEADESGVEKKNTTLHNGSTQSSRQKESSPIEHHPNPYFFNKIIRKHVAGYAIIGIVLLQFFVIPTNVFNIKYPDYLQFVWVFCFGLLTHLAVRNYKKEYLVGGIRYGTVWSITFWLYTFIFFIGGLEIGIIDFIDGKGIASVFILVPIIVLAAYVSGWILSFPIFFMNGGKLVTNPDEIKYREP